MKKMLIHRNTCLDKCNEYHSKNVKFSCAIDSILELMYFCKLGKYIESISDEDIVEHGKFIQLLRDYLKGRKICKDEEELCKLRDVVWDYLVIEENGSFSPKGTDDVIAERFVHQMMLTNKDENVFAVKQLLHCSICDQSDQHIIKNVDLINLSDDKHYYRNMKDGCFSILRKQHKKCKNCQIFFDVTDVKFGKFLLISPALGFRAIKEWHICEQFETPTCTFMLDGLIKGTGGHFVTVVKNNRSILVDDLISIPMISEKCVELMLANRYPRDEPMKGVCVMVFDITERDCFPNIEIETVSNVISKQHDKTNESKYNECNDNLTIGIKNNLDYSQKSNVKNEMNIMKNENESSNHGKKCNEKNVVEMKKKKSASKIKYQKRCAMEKKEQEETRLNVDNVIKGCNSYKFSLNNDATNIEICDEQNDINSSSGMDEINLKDLQENELEMLCDLNEKDEKLLTKQTFNVSMNYNSADLTFGSKSQKKGKEQICNVMDESFEADEKNRKRLKCNEMRRLRRLKKKNEKYLIGTMDNATVSNLLINVKQFTNTNGNVDVQISKKKKIDKYEADIKNQKRLRRNELQKVNRLKKKEEKELKKNMIMNTCVRNQLLHLNDSNETNKDVEVNIYNARFEKCKGDIKNEKYLKQIEYQKFSWSETKNQRKNEELDRDTIDGYEIKYYLTKKEKEFNCLITDPYCKDLNIFKRDLRQSKFNSLCNSCHCIFMEHEVSILNDIILCAYCKKFIIKKVNSPIDHHVMYPGDVPTCLSNLTVMEKRLISLIHPFLSIITLSGGCQFGESGQIINFPTDLKAIMVGLPNASDVDNLIIVNPYRSKQSEQYCNVNNIQNYVSLSNVRDALIYLREFNYIYENNPNINDAIQLLDRKTYLNSNVIQEEDVTNDCDQTLAFNFNALNANIDIREKISGLKLYSKMNATCLKKNDAKPISVCNQSIPFEEMAFPTLFPKGDCGLNSVREEKLSDLKYYNARMLHNDERFSKDPTYIFFALCVVQQRLLNSCISIAMRMKKHCNITAKDLMGNIDTDIVENSYTFMQHIRGSPAYWKNEMSKLLARCVNFGPPTLFVTLSAADSNKLWSELFDALGHTNCDDINRWELLRTNPIRIARHFMRRKQLFMKHILKGKSKPLGKIIEFFIRIEFQKRGSPHLHILLWIANSDGKIIEFETEEGKKNFTYFADALISTELPDKNVDPELYELVNKLQRHCCSKKFCGLKSCRHDFPKPLSNETRLKNNKDVGNPARFYISRRRNENDRWINAYNEHILRAWKANMDIQIVGSVYGLSAYICTYVCKKEPEGLGKAIRKAIGNLPENATNRQRLSKIGNCVYSHREISAQEAGFLLTGLSLVDSSSDVVFCNSRYSEHRDKMILPRNVRNELPMNSKDVFHAGAIEFYGNRPNTMQWNNTNLYDFMTCYRTINDDGKNKNAGIITKYRKMIKKRNKAICLRFPKLTIEKYGDEFYYSRLLLFYPWRNENELFQGYDTAKECYFANIDTLNLTKLKLYDKMQTAIEDNVHKLKKLNETAGIKIDGRNIALSTSMREFNDAINTKICENPYVNITADVNELKDAEEFFDTQMMKNIDENLCDRDTSFLDCLDLYTMNDERYYRMEDMLNETQSEVICLFDKFYDDLELKNKRNIIRLFVTGGAGVGKSFLIEFLNEHLIRRRQRNVILITAYTGAAAKLINGQTLHSALKLSVEFGRRLNSGYTALNPKYRDELMKKLINLELLIVDEISMLSYQQLIQTHLRLNEIMGHSNSNDVFFGGINVLFLGDFHQIQPVGAKFLCCTDEISRCEHLFVDKFEVIYLTENMRQKDDIAFMNLLNRIRIGIKTEEDMETLRSRLDIHIKEASDWESAIRLFPTVDQCLKYNNKKLSELVSGSNGELYRIESIDECASISKEDDIDSYINEKISRNIGLAKELFVAKNAKVMLLRNIDQSKKLVNGTMGTVDSVELNDKGCVQAVYMKLDQIDISGNISQTHIHRIGPYTVRFLGLCGKEITRIQIPLALCWACTIHKVQGQTLKKAVIDLSRLVFGNHMAYVAISRVKKLTDLSLSAFDEASFKISRDVIDYYTEKDAPWSKGYPDESQKSMKMRHNRKRKIGEQYS